MRYGISLSLLTLFCFFTLPPVAHSDSKNVGMTPCRDYLKECFAYGGEERMSCYYETAGLSACAGSKISELLMKRWSLTPPEAAPDMKGLNFTGTQLVNPACLEKFDSSLSAWAVGSIEPEAKDAVLEDMKKFLETCQTKENQSLSFQ